MTNYNNYQPKLRHNGSIEPDYGSDDIIEPPQPGNKKRKPRKSFSRSRIKMDNYQIEHDLETSIKDPWD